MQDALGTADHTEEVVEQLRTTIRARIATFAKPEQLPGRRQIKVSYRGHELAVKVETVEQEISLNIYSIIKGRGVEQCKLQALYCEDALCSSTPLCGSGMVHPKLLEASSMARSLAREALPDDAVTSSDVIKALLLRKESNLCAIDPDVQH